MSRSVFFSGSGTIILSSYLQPIYGLEDRPHVNTPIPQDYCMTNCTASWS